MDPVSIAAGIAGVVTLGLQICGGLVTYCKAWRSYDKEIEKALERLTILVLTLESLDKTLSEAKTNDDDSTDNFRVARDKIYSCTANLNTLHSLLVELESIGEPAGVLDKIHNVRLRSIALFHKEKFRRLQGSVKDTQLKLDSAMQILQLQLDVRQISTLERLATVHRETADQIPRTIEHEVNKQLDLYGRHWSALQQDTASQHTQALQNLTNSISALQLTMIQKPSLLRSVADEERQIQSQNTNSQRRSLQQCTCRAFFKSKTFGQSRSYWEQKRPTLARWSAATFSSSLTHHRDCMLSRKSQETKQFGLRISFSGPLLQGAIQAAMSTTRGSGGFSLSPSLAFNYVVRSGTGPFKLFESSSYHPRSADVSTAKVHAILELQRQELIHLYQQGSASPSDVDENGNTVFHMICRNINELRYAGIETGELYEAYIQFLRDLYELGVPLNRTNAKGLTPLGELIAEFYIFQPQLQAWLQLFFAVLDLGAELPLLTLEILDKFGLHYVHLISKFTGCTELAEAFCCNEISLAIVAKARPWLISAIFRHPELVNQPNSLGQTALHLSVYWPDGLQYLLEIGADVDATDRFGYRPIFYAAILGLHEPLKLLGEKECLLYSTHESLLECVIRCAYIKHDPKALEKNSHVDLSTVIRLVVERRKKLEVLARTLLDAKAVQSLRLSTEAVLDGKASHAISMLREKTNIPAWLTKLTPEHGTVYHIRRVIVEQAQILWDSGFREIDELDGMGLSPLMTLGNYRHCCADGHIEYWEMVVWLLAKGADLHRRQKSVFRKPSEDAYGRGCPSIKASSTTALHYLAAEWGEQLGKDLTVTTGYARSILPGLEAISEQVRRLQINVLTDTMHDSCNCACSATGCRAFTMMVKTLVMKMEEWRCDSVIETLPSLLQVSEGLAQLLDVDKTGLAWLRRDIIRFNTFQKLDLRHACCQMDHGWFDRRYKTYIYEPYDDEEIHEIQEEQAEDLEKLETLLAEFEDKYEESGSSLKEFLGGYWSDRMDEVLKEEGPVDHEALENMGIVLQRENNSSPCSSDHDE